MDRLTGWDNGHAYFTECFEEPCLGMGCVNEDCEFKILACQRLAEYEDIGLIPEQLLEIDKMYSEKCREVAELRKQLSEKTTAYDVDKAIEKLESKARGEWGYPSVMEFEDVVNIVKAGGVDE